MRRARKGLAKRAAVGAVVVGLAVAVMCVATPLPLAAQSPTLAELDARYEAATNAKQSAEDAYDAGQIRFERAMLAFSSDATEAATTEFWEASAELNRMKRRLEDANADLEEARSALYEALDEYRRSLNTQLLVASVDERQGLEARLDDVERQLVELETPLDDFDVSELFASPVAYDPRDGPARIRQKIVIGERQLADVDSAVTKIEAEIATIDERLEQQQRLREFQDGVRRFDDTSTPVGTDPQNDQLGNNVVSVPSDTTMAVSAMPLPQRRAALERMLEETRAYRDGLAENVAELKALVGGRGP